ncbi:hypothetical protein B0H19DRAFT_1275554 [Mycena capillaripes]|nr:hypothetical protein B0H19DRAFT_1275554 [Mycena capillaripes]
MLTFKGVVIGAPRVGKISLRGQYISARFSSYRTTIVADLITKNLPSPSLTPGATPIILHLGSHRWRTLFLLPSICVLPRQGPACVVMRCALRLLHTSWGHIVYPIYPQYHYVARNNATLRPKGPRELLLFRATNAFEYF